MKDSILIRDELIAPLRAWLDSMDWGDRIAFDEEHCEARIHTNVSSGALNFRLVVTNLKQPRLIGVHLYSKLIVPKERAATAYELLGKISGYLCQGRMLYVDDECIVYRDTFKLWDFDHGPDAITQSMQAALESMCFWQPSLIKLCKGQETADEALQWALEVSRAREDALAGKVH